MSCGHITHNGELLDTSRDFLRITRNVEELTDLAQIKVDGALGFSMPDTETNRKYLRPLIDPHLDERGRWIDVEVQAGGHVTRFTRLFVLEYSRGRYEVELRLPETHWTEQAKNLLLKDIEIEDIELTQGNVADSWDNVPYVDGNSPWVFPPAFYGVLMRRTYLGIEDFRPWIWDLALLQKGFCQIGWDFKSSILESSIGRSNASYLIDQGYYEISKENQPQFQSVIDFDGLSNSSGFNVDYTISQDPLDGVTINGDILTFKRIGTFNVEVYVNGNFNNIEGDFFRFDLREFFTVDGDLTSVTIERKIITDFPSQSSGGSSHYQVNYKTDSDVNLSTGEYIEFSLFEFISYSFGSWFNDFNGRVVITSTNIIPSNGHIFRWGDMVDPELTLFDFLKAKQHQFNALVDENAIEKKISLLPPKNVTWGDDDLEGYITDSINDLNGKKIFNSEKSSNLEANKDRFVKIKYQDSTDPTIEDEEIFSKIIDLGIGDEGTEDRENPLFEPTVLTDQRTLSGGGNSVFLPTLTDNESGEYSTKISPRNILVGDRRVWWQTIPGISIPAIGTVIPKTIRLWDFQNIEDSLIVGWMKPFYYRNLGGGVFELPQNLVFGDMDNDLGSKFWLADLLERFKNIGIEALINLNKADFFKWSFRDQYVFDTFGKLLLCRADTINDFQPCSEISTPVNFRPLKLFLDCEITPVVECNNFPTLEITSANNCWSWTTGGEFEEVPTIVTEYRLVSETVWTTGTELCNPSEGFFVRARFEFENCPDLFLVRFVDGCGNSPVLMFDFNGSCLTIEVGGSFVSEVQSSTITYTIGEGEPQTYTEPICDFEGEVCASAVIVYEGNCPNGEVEGCYDLQLSDCDNNDTAFTITETAGVVTFSRDQPLVTTPQFDQFHYKLAEEDEWRIWAGEDIIGCELWVKRVVIFCDLCPSLCSDVVHYTFIQGGVNFEVYQIGNTLKAFGACTYEWYDGETLLGTGDTLEVDCSTAITVKGVCGTCESEKVIDFCEAGACPTIEAEPVAYVPAATGNTENLCQFITDSKGQSWFIDANGNARILSAVIGVQKFTLASGMFVTITNFDLPSDLLTAEEISKKLIVNRQTNIQIYDESYTIDSANNRVYFEWELESEVVEVVLLN